MSCSEKRRRIASGAMAFVGVVLVGSIVWKPKDISLVAYGSDEAAFRKAVANAGYALPDSPEAKIGVIGCFPVPARIEHVRLGAYHVAYHSDPFNVSMSVCVCP